MKLLENATDDTESAVVTIAKTINTLSIKGSYGGGTLVLYIDTANEGFSAVASVTQSSPAQAFNLIAAIGTQFKVVLENARDANLSVGLM